LPYGDVRRARGAWRTLFYRKRKDFVPRVAGYTDDTLLTVAAAHAILTGEDMAETIKGFANLDSDSYVDAVQNPVSLGGNVQAYYRHAPADIVPAVRRKLTLDLREAVDRFEKTYGCPF